MPMKESISSAKKKGGTGKAEKKKEKKETMEDLIKKLEGIRGSKVISLFYPSPSSITHDTVADVYDLLNTKLEEPVDKLDVIIDSHGGDIDASFHIVKLLRRFVKPNGELNFIIPRYAKSAATLITAGGDKICMGSTSEIGPLDPQITRVTIKDGKPFEGESFSPLAISSTINFLKELLKKGRKKGAEENTMLAQLLVDKLLPLSLGQYLKSLDIGKSYTQKLLLTRMFNENDEKKVEEISERLVRGYSHHGYCIDIDEAREIGLVVDELDETQWEIVWRIYKLYRQKADELMGKVMEK